jgi:hypothetical protein
LEDVRKTGRNAQGVIVWRDREADDYVASIAVFQENVHERENESEESGSNGAGGSRNGHRQVNGANPANGSNGSDGDK